MDASKVFPAAAVLVAFAITSLHGSNVAWNELLVHTASTMEHVQNLTRTYGTFCNCENGCKYNPNYKPFNIYGNKVEILKKIYSISGEYQREIKPLTINENRSQPKAAIFQVLHWLCAMHDKIKTMLPNPPTNATNTTTYIKFQISKCFSVAGKSANRCDREIYITMCGLEVANGSIKKALETKENATFSGTENWSGSSSQFQKGTNVSQIQFFNGTMRLGTSTGR